MSNRKMTMTPKWRQSLTRARQAREAKARERGSRYTESGLERMREIGKRMMGNLSVKGRPTSREAIADADALVIQLFDAFATSPLLVSELAKRAGVSGNTLRAWKNARKIPTLTAFRDAAFALGYVLKLERFEQRPRDKSIWLAPRATTFNDGTLR